MADRAPGRGTRVWIVNQYAVAPDRPAAAGSRHYDLARLLVARGDRVTIFAAGVSHLTGREERLGPGRLYRTDWFGGVRFVWLRTLPYRGNTWRRSANMLTYLVTFLVVQTRHGRPDVIVGSTVHPFAAFGAWLAAKLRGARFVLEIRDLWPQTLVDIGAIRPGSPGERLLRRLEAFLVRRASVVITLLPGMRQYLDGQGLPAEHVMYIPNGVDLSVFGALAPDAVGAPGPVVRSLEEIRRLRADGRFVLGYVGTFGRVNSVAVIVRAAEIAERQAPGRIGLVLVGDGPDRDDLEGLASSIPAVALCPAIAKKFVPAILGALDGTVVHATATPVYRYGISFNKLFEYMAAGRPVVFACESAYDPVTAAGAGITIQPNDAERIAEAFLQLAGLTPEARQAMGTAGRAYVERHHDLTHLGEVFATVLEDGPRGAPNRGSILP